MPFRYGLLLPHFGKYASREALVGMAPKIENLGFDSVWVRDHIIFHPHPFEDPDRTHVEPMTVLSAISAVTERLLLGFASLIPHRHPIYTALALESLEWIAGPGRIIAGWGLGTYDHEFAAVGLGGIDRREMLREQIDIMREMWSGNEVSYSGEIYSFDKVDIHPEPAGAGMPVWYCGNSVASVRRTVEWGLQGWMPGRITYGGFARRVRRLGEFVDAHGASPSPEIAAIPIVTPGSDFADGASRIDVPGLLREARHRQWVPNESGVFESARDLAGAILCGNADDIVEQINRYQELGANHLVFDLRSRFSEWQECVYFLGEEVLPRLKR